MHSWCVEPSGLTVLWEVISNLVLLCSCLGCCYLVERCRKMFDGPSSGHLYVPKLQFTCRWCNMFQNVADVEWCWWCWWWWWHDTPKKYKKWDSNLFQVPTVSHSVPQWFSWLRLASYLHRASLAIQAIQAMQAMRRANISTRPGGHGRLFHCWIWNVVFRWFTFMYIYIYIYFIFFEQMLRYIIYIIYVYIIYIIYYEFTCQCVV